MRLQTRTVPSLLGTCRKRCKPAHKPNLRQEPSSPSRPNTRTERCSKYVNVDRMNKGQLVYAELFFISFYKLCPDRLGINRRYQVLRCSLRTKGIFCNDTSFKNFRPYCLCLYILPIVRCQTIPIPCEATPLFRHLQ